MKCLGMVCMCLVSMVCAQSDAQGARQPINYGLLRKIVSQNYSLYDLQKLARPFASSDLCVNSVEKNQADLNRVRAHYYAALAMRMADYPFEDHGQQASLYLFRAQRFGLDVSFDSLAECKREFARGARKQLSSVMTLREMLHSKKEKHVRRERFYSR